MKPLWCLLFIALLIGLLTLQPTDEPQASASQPLEPAPRRSADRIYPPLFHPFAPRASQPARKKGALKLKNAPYKQRPKPAFQNVVAPPEQALDDVLAENRAATEVARLHRLLDLTHQQKDQLFEVLQSRASPKHPTILLRTRRSEFRNPTRLPSTAPRTRDRPTRDPEPNEEDKIAEILTPPQNQTLLAEEREADLWWTDILADIDRTP